MLYCASAAAAHVEEASRAHAPGDRRSRGPHLHRGHRVSLASLNEARSTLTLFRSAQKGGIIDAAASHGLAVVFPDTSPRDAKIAGEEDDWDFGTGSAAPPRRSRP